MSFYLSWQSVSPRTDRYRAWLQGVRTGKLNTILQIPVFDISPLPWVGATYIATEFWGTTDQVFSIRKPQVNPSNFNFFLCVRTPQRNTDGLSVTRYKLWEPNENVRLDTFPLYREERLATAFVIEVWTLPSSEQVSISDVESLITSLIVDPSRCCDHTGPVIELVENCALWAVQNVNSKYSIPIQFNTCFNAISPIETFYRKTELEDIRVNELDEKRTYV